MRQCVVSFVDFAGIRHSAELQADSMYEAAAAALEAFRQHDCSPGIGSELEVQVRTSVTHTIGIKKLRDWADVGGASPSVVSLKCLYNPAASGCLGSAGLQPGMPP
jgi:hypothetical protein